MKMKIKKAFFSIFCLVVCISVVHDYIHFSFLLLFLVVPLLPSFAVAGRWFLLVAVKSLFIDLASFDPIGSWGLLDFFGIGLDFFGGDRCRRHSRYWFGDNFADLWSGQRH